MNDPKPPRGLRPGDVVGFTFRRDVLCGECIVERMVAAGIASPAARDMPLANVIGQCAEAQGVNLDGAYSPSAFPVLLSRADVARDLCAHCSEMLVDLEALDIAPERQVTLPYRPDPSDPPPPWVSYSGGWR